MKNSNIQLQELCCVKNSIVQLQALCCVKNGNINKKQIQHIISKVICYIHMYMCIFNEFATFHVTYNTCGSSMKSIPMFVTGYTEKGYEMCIAFIVLFFAALMT